MKNRIFYTFIFLLISLTSFAQQKTITGLVTDATDGSVVPGVTVEVKNKPEIGTATDGNGAYSIIASVGDSLVFTYIGKLPVIKVVGKQNVIVVTLYDDTKSLGEVTVVAFGKQKKESVVSSIETVNVSDLKIPSSNLTAAFAGRIPGLISYTTTGEPGRDNAKFFVRGVTTFGYNVDPLIIIDGFESTSDDLAHLQVDDIESFSVLKDASATVLYGSRAANGIIIITTKKGTEGAVKLNIRIDDNVSTPTQILKLVDGVTYMRMYNEAWMTRNPLLGPFYDEQKIQSTIDNVNPMIYPNVDWYKKLFKNSTNNTRVNLNVSGGGQLATFYVAGGYEHETGLLNVDPLNNYNSNISINRFDIRSNVNFKLTPTTTLETQVSGRFERQTGPWENMNDTQATTRIYNDIMNSNPVDFPAVYAPDAANQYDTWTLFGNTYTDGALKANPYADMTNGFTDRNESTILAQATLKQNLSFITKGLEVQLKASVNSWSKYTSTRSYTPFYYDLQSYDQISGDYTLWCLNPTWGSAYLGDVDPGRDATFKYYFEGRANWSGSYGLNHVGAMVVGISQEQLLTSGKSTSIYETLPQKNAGISGRFTYDFDTRYFLEYAFGYNGSEKFDGSKRFGFFPSVAAGWLISNEKFWAPLKNAFSTFKLKGSIGKIGNDAIAQLKDRFFYLSDITIWNNLANGDAWNNGYRWGESFMNAYGGYTINRYANPDITWETSTKWNAGVEAYFLKDNLKFQLDRFGENRTNIYLQRENFPATAGLAASVSGNVGALKAWGWDGSIDYQQFFNKNFWLQGRVNLTYADNKYTQMDEKDYPDKYLKHLGHNVNQQWGLIAERLFVDDKEIANSPQQDFGAYMAGDIKYKDINGDGVVNANDKVPLGYPTVPKMQYGFGLSGGYKNADLSFFFQGNAMVSFFINPAVADADGNQGLAPFVNRRNALQIVANDYWSETNPNVYAFWPRLSTMPIDNNTQQSSWWLRDGSFLRLKSLEVGYNFPQLKKWSIQTCRLYVTFEDLFVLSKFKLWDPEMGSNGLGYPPNRRYNLGLQLSF